MGKLTPEESVILLEYETQAVPVLERILAAFKAKEAQLQAKEGVRGIGVKWDSDSFGAVDFIEALMHSDRKFIKEKLKKGGEIKIQGDSVYYCSYSGGLDEYGNTRKEYNYLSLVNALGAIRGEYETSHSESIQDIGEVLGKIAKKNKGKKFDELSQVDQDFIQAVNAYDDFRKTWVAAPTTQDKDNYFKLHGPKSGKHKTERDYELGYEAERDYELSVKTGSIAYHRYSKVAAAAQKFARQTAKDVQEEASAAERREEKKTGGHVGTLLAQARGAQNGKPGRG